MDGDQSDYSGQVLGEANLQIRDVKEKQKILKDRLLLIGENLIETKEKTQQEIIEIKKNIEIMKQNIERIRSFLETLSGELSKFARREDLEILSKQARMFQPLELINKK